MVEVIPDSSKTHWVNRAPENIRPYLQLSRLDRPVGYWLLALPGWIGLAFAGLSHGLFWSDLKWAVLILIGAIAMREAGCSYNDIVDQDLDAQVERTALRPLPAGTVTTKQAWKWTFAQIGIGFLVWLALPLLAKGIALLALPLVAAYPFMKRITWFPQVWLGMTFNWAVLVAYTIKTGTVSLPLFILYLGLIFWTIGYDTIYACQDIEDDAFVGIKSTARKFGNKIKIGVGSCFFASWVLISLAMGSNFRWNIPVFTALAFILILPYGLCLIYQFSGPWRKSSAIALKKFKFSFVTGIILTLNLTILRQVISNIEVAY